MLNKENLVNFLGKLREMFSTKTPSYSIGGDFVEGPDVTPQPESKHPQTVKDKPEKPRTDTKKRECQE